MSGRPTLIVFYSGTLYDFSDEMKLKFGKSSNSEPLLTRVEPPETATFTIKDLLPKAGMLMGNGDGYAIAKLAGMFGSRGKDYLIEKGNEATFDNFRNHPSVLIGAFNNAWSMGMIREARFVFERDQASGNRPVIRDRQAPGRIYGIPSGVRTLEAKEDYALVSRVFLDETGQPLVLLAGITQNGTRGAGEFAVDPKLMDAAFRKVRADWPQKNVQLLLHMKVFNGIPAPASVIEAHVW
jgi:hypothetical protein